MWTLPWVFQPDASETTKLKWRLNWGEPALSIIDIRDREDFRKERISGAMSMPFNELKARATAAFESIRDIYVYGESDESTAQAVSMLKEAGFASVAAIPGGLNSWKEISGAIEGSEATA